ncbi:MAG: hypothetical protein EOO53_18930 [Gammaproteobacteria bacterium]|nr:MAG: hypothetical protein EOO53_18930 [Gammaproteobacteria bacterium]
MPENAQDVRFSDDATGMSHRNDGNLPKRAGNTNEMGRLSFGYFSLAKQRKVTRRGRNENLLLILKLQLMNESEMLGFVN